jgi:hypothetical protein
MKIIYSLSNTDNYYRTYILKTHFTRKILLLTLDFCECLLVV